MVPASLSRLRWSVNSVSTCVTLLVLITSRIALLWQIQRKISLKSVNIKLTGSLRVSTGATVIGVSYFPAALGINLVFIPCASLSLLFSSVSTAILAECSSSNLAVRSWRVRFMSWRVMILFLSSFTSLPSVWVDASTKTGCQEYIG